MSPLGLSDLAANVERRLNNPVGDDGKFLPNTPALSVSPLAGSITAGAPATAPGAPAATAPA